jgi:hypothetical protein
LTCNYGGSLSQTRELNQLVFVAGSLEDIRIGGLADLAFELFEDIAANVRVFFSSALCFHPFLKAGIVHILNTPAALARR